MTNAIIKLIIAYAECLRRAENIKLRQASRRSNPARAGYLHHCANKLAADRAALEAMVRLYMARTQIPPKTRKAA